VPLQNTGFRSFPIHGRLYAFTTLRPPPPPDGSLRLVAMNENSLNGVIVTLLLVVGVVFLPRSFAAKLLALSLLLTSFVLAGVFAPTLAMQILDTWLAVGVAVMIITWIAATVFMSRRQLNTMFAMASAARTHTEAQSVAVTQPDAGTAENATEENATVEDEKGEAATGGPGESPFVVEDDETEGGETNA